MAIPVGVLVSAAEAARNPIVQETARTIFGWLKRQRSAAPAVPMEGLDMAALLVEIPTRAELALALAQIDVRIAQAERRCIQVVGGGLLVSTALLAALVILF